MCTEESDVKMCQCVVGMVVRTLTGKVFLTLDRLTVHCSIKESILYRTRCLFFSLFLFTEKFQIKFPIPSGVISVVRLCFGSGVEPELLQSVYRLSYGDGVIPVVSADLLKYP